VESPLNGLITSEGDENLHGLGEFFRQDALRAKDRDSIANSAQLQREQTTPERSRRRHPVGDPCGAPENSRAIAIRLDSASSNPDCEREPEPIPITN